MLLLLAAGCSTQKNTAKSRRYHSFMAKYNTYYNGSQAYINGSVEKENGNKDNFTEIIPLYTVGNKSSRELGKSNFTKAIEKSQKAIKLHSIKKKPEWTKKRRKTEKDLEWLNRKEYNPFLWKAWMLMGRSQFYSGNFDEAASTFAYMSRLYQTQPAIYGKARAWLAKSYIEQDWLYDAEDVIRNMRRDSIHWAAKKEWDYTYADYYIHNHEYEKAIPYLKNVIKHEMRRKQKAREWFLLGQLQSELGQKDLAYKSYKHVVRLSPPYEVEFNARIAMTEVMANSQSKQIISRLKRMAYSDKNKDYLDQVYYAIGNTYLSQRDTVNAIAAYEKGNSKSTRNGIEKGVLLLKLGGLYWDKEKYNDAQRCYGEAIGLLDKERKDYEQLAYRSKVLDELVPYTDAVHLQDSLQALAKMSEADRNAAIDRVIEALKKKEKEERDRLAEENAEKVTAANGGNDTNTRQNRNTANNNTQQNGTWYFYNQMVVNQGKTAFQKQWGRRENVDNWQRVNKTVVAMNNDNDNDDDNEALTDSLGNIVNPEEDLSNESDSAQNDPHKREYYLAQIPFSEDQVRESNLIIMDGLYNSGVIFKDKFDNLPLSQKALRRLTDQYPDYEGMENAYYHLFLLYSRMGRHDIAEGYVNLLKSQYPESQWTTILTDPYFVENSQFGVHIEDSLYAATYEAFKNDRYNDVAANYHISDTRFPLGANRDKFIFINGLTMLNNGNADGCLESMNTLIEKFPQSKLSEMAGMIINGVNSGKKLRGGKFNMANVWQRRMAVMSDSDSIAARQFSNERNTDFAFIIAYQPDSVDENKMLFQLAKYNFTNYMVRNFDINIEDADGLHLMQIDGFRNFDEALQYARQLVKQENIVALITHARTFIISKQNQELLGQQFSYDEYDEFYNEHFAPLKISTFELLTEPEEVPLPKEKPTTVEQIDDWLNDYFDGPTGTNIDNDFIIEPEGQDNNAPQNQDVIIPDNQVNMPQDNVDDNVIPLNDVTPDAPTDNDEIVIPQENVNAPAVDNGEIVIPEEENKVVEEEDNITIPDIPVTTPITTATPQPSPEVKEPEPKVKEPEPEVKKQEPEVKKPEPKKQEADDDTIYFEDDMGVDLKPATSTKKSATSTTDDNKKNNKSPDLDDEYYDLDGF